MGEGDWDEVGLIVGDEVGLIVGEGDRVEVGGGADEASSGANETRFPAFSVVTPPVFPDNNSEAGPKWILATDRGDSGAVGSTET